MFTTAFVSLVLAGMVFASSATPNASPQTISLFSRLLPKGSLVRRALSPITLPLGDYFNGTDLQWFGHMGIGTPPQNITIVFDTGSDTLEVASTLCGAACANEVQFNSSKSSTFVDGGVTNTITFGTGIGVEPVVGNNWQLTLRNATDTVSINGISVPNVALFLVTDQTAAFASDPISGIQGMSTMANGLFAGLEAQGLPSLFSLFLTPQAVGNAELTLGGIDTTKFQGNLTYSSLATTKDDSWQLTSSSVNVNGNSSSALSGTRNWIFDSGTSNLVMTQADAEAIYAQISPSIKPFADEPNTYGIACSEISSLPANISFTFTDQSGNPFSLVVPSSELSVGPFSSNPDICQTLINTFPGALWIVGASLFKHYYTVWDLGGKRLGFAPVDTISNNTNSTSAANNTNTPSSAHTRHSHSLSVAPWLGLVVCVLASSFI